MRLPNQESPQNQAYIPFISLFRQQQYLIPPTATQHGHRLDPQFRQVKSNSSNSNSSSTHSFNAVHPWFLGSYPPYINCVSQNANATLVNLATSSVSLCLVNTDLRHAVDVLG